MKSPSQEAEWSTLSKRHKEAGITVTHKERSLPVAKARAGIFRSVEQVNRPYFFFIPTSPALASISILLLPFPKM